MQKAGLWKRALIDYGWMTSWFSQSEQRTVWQHGDGSFLLFDNHLHILHKHYAIRQVMLGITWEKNMHSVIPNILLYKETMAKIVLSNKYRYKNSMLLRR